MKYANIIWHNTEIPNSEYRTVNIGDTLQFLAIDYIYQLAGIQKDEIVYLTLSDLKTYKGEKLLLPLNWALFDLNYMDGIRIAISEDVEPLFLAVTIESYNHKDDFFNEENIEYLKKYEPVGCRDYITYKKLMEYGINSYVNGCNTSLFPTREKNASQNKVLLIDAPIEMEKYIPREIFDSAESMTQQYYCSQKVNYEKIRNQVIKQYKYIVDNASLVITSRLHIASPCLAMGIPVIFVKDKVDNRFSWINKHLKLYNGNDYNKIDWNPGIVDIEIYKTKIKDIVVKRILRETVSQEEYHELHQMYSLKVEDDLKYQNTIQSNFDKIDKFLSERFSLESDFSYVIWGMGKAAHNFYTMMQAAYPKAHLSGAIDAYKKGDFQGLEIVSPDQYQYKDGEYIFVLPVGASNVAADILIKKGICSDNFICAGDVFIKKNYKDLFML